MIKNTYYILDEGEIILAIQEYLSRKGVYVTSDEVKLVKVEESIKAHVEEK